MLTHFGCPRPGAIARRSILRAAATLSPLALVLALAACGGGSDGAGSSSTTAVREAPQAIAAPAASRWSALIPLSIVPAAGANLPDGKVLLWSAEDRFTFLTPGLTGRTYSTVLDPATGIATERLVTETGHDMFCPGTTNLPDGRILVSGGIDAGKTSIYDPATNTWATAAQMNITRAYQANTILQDGSVLTLGGSWIGGQGNKHGEVWTEAGGWRRLSGLLVDPFITKDKDGIFRADNHMWLYPTGDGRVLHAGPSKQMNWISTAGIGGSTPAGDRGDDVDAMNASTAMYDIGKILKTGGALNYSGEYAQAGSYVIDANAGVTVRKIVPMNYARVFHNNVVLPNGQVLVVGGQTYSAPLSDDNSVLRPELWDPATETFTLVPAMAAPRNYHSVALLLPDARVLSTGGGLCGAGCSANHPDAQIWTPHYLLNADGTAAARPLIQTAPAQAAYGTTTTVVTNTAIESLVLIRMSSSTHTVNNDQRRIPLTFRTTAANTYSVDIPSNPGIALPGIYMLFALNNEGTPSVARIVRIGTDTTARIVPAGDQAGAVGTATALTLAGSVPAGGAITWSATGLPPGLVMNPAGTISGTPNTGGRYLVTVYAATAGGRSSTDFVWTISGSGGGTGATPVRYVRLQQLTEIQDRAWASMAEFNVLDASGNVIPRTGWVASADSAESSAGAAAPAALAIDGSAGSIWHTQWVAAAPRPPHTFTVDMGTARVVGGFRYLPRQDGNTAGVIAQFNFYVSTDGVNWGNPVASGDFSTMGATAAEKTVLLTGTSPGNRNPVLTTPVAQTGAVGTPLTLAVAGSDPDGDPLAWSATGLPSGLAIGATSGVISGTPVVAGTSTVTVTVQDGRGGSSSTGFAWTITSGEAAVSQVQAAPVVSGGTASFSVTATGTGLTYAWDFGDGSPRTAHSASPNATHAYAQPGLYTVTLYVRSASGAETTVLLTQAVHSAPTAVRPTASSNLLFEARTGANARLWVVNPDNDSVSVFDAVTRAKLAEVTVGAGPRTLALGTNGRVWVANQDAGSLSLISTSTLAVVQTIAMARASQPYGVAISPADGSAFVTLAATGQLVKLTAAGAVSGTLAVGSQPRQVSISADGARVLVSRFITPPLPGEATAVVATTRNGVAVGGEVVAVRAGTLALERTTTLRHSDKADNSLQGRGIPNYLGAAVIAPDGGSAWVPSKQDNILRGALRDGLSHNFETTVRAISSRIDLGSLTEDYAARIDHDNASVASAAVFHPTGAYLFVALETSRQFAVVDPIGKQEVLRLEAGRAPQGMAISADGLTLYVSNFMDRSVGVYDLTRLVRNGEFVIPLVVTLNAVGAEKLSAQVLTGKQFFYDARDARLSRDAYMSCATCHRDGSGDGRTWDFTGRGEGLRNTISLIGRAGMGQGRLHWSANFDEVQDFEAQIRSLSGGSGLMTDAQFNTGTRSQPLGDRKTGVSADLDALAAYVTSLASFPPSPFRAADGSLTAAAVQGKALFTAQCVQCHTGAGFTDSGSNLLHDIGTLKPSSGTRLGGALNGIDTPTLRDAWATAPYLHDGSAATLGAAISAHDNVTLTAAQIEQVAAYVQQIGAEEPAAGGGTGGGGSISTRYVRLQQVTEIQGRAWASMAEFNVLDANGANLSRSGWVATADSAETSAGAAAPAALAIDGSTGSIWHTQWVAASPLPPHTYTVDFGATRSITGFKYLPRQDGNTPGVFAQFRFYVSNDGVNWGEPVASGDFTTMGATAAEKTVLFGTVTPPANQAPTITSPGARTGTVGTAATLTVAAADPDGDSLTFSATGLPAGLSIAPATGVISGTPTTAGTSTVAVTVQDGRGGSATTSFGWTITAAGGGTGVTARYVRLQQVTEIQGRAWASMAEFNVLDASGNNLARTGWVATADSAETSAGAAAPASMAIDGSAGSIWHTQWVTASPVPPHTFTVDLGATRTISGFRYLPRQDGNTPGVIAQFRFYVSNDGVNWGTPVSSGDFTTMGATAAEKTVRF